MGLYDDKGRAKYWLYTFKLPGQKQVKGTTKYPVMLEGRRSAANKKLAQSVFEQARQEALTNKHLNIPKKILLSDLTELWLTTKSTEDCNVENYRSTLKPGLAYFEGRFAQEIPKEEWERYRVWRRQPNADGISISRSTVNKEMAYFGAAYNKGIEWKRVLENPCTGIKKYNVKELWRTRYLSFEEKSSLLLALSQSDTAFSTPLAAVVRFALMTGMRRGEILNLKWSSVDLVRGILTVEESKGGSKRWLPVNNQINDLLARQSRACEYVFTWAGERVKEDSLCHAFIRCAKASGLLDVHFHDLRHTFASDCLAKGASLSELQDLLGHASPVMTQRYAHLSKEMKRAAMMAMPALPDYPVFIPSEKIAPAISEQVVVS